MITTKRHGVKTIEVYDDWSLLGGPGKLRTMRFPSLTGEKRTIYVRVSTWVGTSVGARHIYVEVKEERNQYWSEIEEAWIEIESSSETSGYYLKADVYSEREARKIAMTFITMIGGKDLERHEVHWHGPARPRKFKSGY